MVPFRRPRSSFSGKLCVGGTAAMVKREHQPRRRASVRPERTRILVYCGGTRTEPAYFEGIRAMMPSGSSISLQVKSKRADPAGLVRHAARFAEQNPDFYQEIWCV